MHQGSTLPKVNHLGSSLVYFRLPLVRVVRDSRRNTLIIWYLSNNPSIDFKEVGKSEIPGKNPRSTEETNSTLLAEFNLVIT